MNGRCETDPFDQARNVCGICYGEFCSSCLVDVKGRQHPLCKECAIISSGIRAGAKPATRGQKRTAVARRAALQEAPIQDSFQFFDDTATAAAPPNTVSDSNTDSGKPATARKKPEKKKATRKAGAKRSSSKKNKPATAGSTKRRATKPKSKQVDAEADQAEDGSASSAEKKVDVAEQATQSAGDERPSSSSAVDQLDSIRGLETADTAEPSSFRKPRPFIKPKSKSSQATPEPETQTKKPSIFGGEARKALTEQDTPAKAEEPSNTSELTSPFSVASPPPLPRRRASPTAGNDPNERADPDAAETTPPAEPVARRRSDPKSAPEPVTVEPSGSAAPQPPYCDSAPPAAPLPKRRRSSDDSEKAEAGHQPAASERAQLSPMGPPAWTQRSHARKDDAPEPASVDDQQKTDDNNDQDQTVASGTTPLPRRRRTT